jgi:alanyl-tRNA synthetase
MVLSSCSIINANELLQKMLEDFGGRGGGNPKVAQGKLNRDPPDLREYIQESVDKDQLLAD